MFIFSHRESAVLPFEYPKNVSDLAKNFYYRRATLRFASLRHTYSVIYRTRVKYVRPSYLNFSDLSRAFRDKYFYVP